MQPGWNSSYLHKYQALCGSSNNQTHSVQKAVKAAQWLELYISPICVPLRNWKHLQVICDLISAAFTVDLRKKNKTIVKVLVAE